MGIYTFIVDLIDENSLSKYFSKEHIKVINEFIRTEYDKRSYLDGIYGIKFGIFRDNEVTIFKIDNHLLFFIDPSSEIYDFLAKKVLEKRFWGADELIYLFEDLLDNIYKIIDKTDVMISNMQKNILQTQKINIRKFLEINDSINSVIRNIYLIKDTIHMIFRDLKNDREVSSLVEAYIKDCDELLNEAIELRHKLNNSYNLYIGETQRTLNEKIEKLTVLSTIFLPATFIASLYGMNFQIDIFPSWDYKYGFRVALLMIVLSSIITLLTIKYIYRRIEILK